MTWDGPQVSYLESLFLPIFEGLKVRGWDFDVLQFRWGEKALEERSRAACQSAGVGYRAVTIRRWGGGAGPFLSAVLGRRHVRSAVRAFGSDIIMPRGMMPAISVLAAGGRKLGPLVFDADGLPTDERVDVAGIAPTSATYRILRDLEAQMARVSRSVITRTEPSAEILYHRAGPPMKREDFHVVANARDEAVFHPYDAEARADVRRRLGIEPTCPLLVYAGSVGPQYRFEAMKALFGEVRRLRQDARLLVLTGSPERASQELYGGAPGALIMRVPPNEVPPLLAAADVGLAYRSTSFSMLGIAPVKLSEYLLCGLPVIGTAAIGDTKPVVEEGVLFDDQGGSEAAARWLLGEVMPRREVYRQKAREVGRAQFSLPRSIEDYSRALRTFGEAKRPETKRTRSRSADDGESGILSNAHGAAL